MIFKIILFSFIFIIFLFRATHVKKSLRIYVLSFVIVIAGINIITIADVYGTRPGAFGSYVGLYPSLLFAILFHINVKGKYLYINRMGAMIAMILLLIVFNTNNVFKMAMLPPLINISQFLLYLYVLRRRLSISSLYLVLYESFTVWTILEFTLTLCYPILGLDFVGSLFHDELALEWANRRDNYLSAIGTFEHPALLAYVCAGYACFYFTSYLNNYKKQSSMLFLLLNIFVIFFTYSRTTYVALFISMAVIYMLNKHQKISWKYVYYIISGLIVGYFITLIPFVNNLFFKSDSDAMVSARMVHWYAGLEIWSQFKILGTGLNNHVYYMSNNSSLMETLAKVDEFYVENPIHNIHIIVLVETGLVGILFWFWSGWTLCKKAYHSIMTNTDVVRNGGLIIIAYVLFIFIYGFWGWSFFNIHVFSPFVAVIYFLTPMRIRKKSIGSGCY